MHGDHTSTTPPLADRATRGRTHTHAVNAAVAAVAILTATTMTDDIAVAWQLGGRWPLLAAAAALGYWLWTWRTLAREHPHDDHVDRLSDGPLARRYNRLLASGVTSAAAATLALPQLAFHLATT